MDDKLNLILEKLEKLDNQIEVLEIKQGMTHKKLDDIAFDAKVTERAIRKDIHALQDAQETLIAVLEAKGILPKVVE